MKAFSQHVLAAARCIEMRGPAQFRNPVGLKLFMQIRRILVCGHKKKAYITEDTFLRCTHCDNRS
jgi:hypothetical protein